MVPLHRRFRSATARGRTLLDPNRHYTVTYITHTHTQTIACFGPEEFLFTHTKRGTGCRLQSWGKASYGLAMTHADVLDQTQHGSPAPTVAVCGWLVNGANLVQGSILSPAMAWGRTGARE
jgi:hypothetical protein